MSETGYKAVSRDLVSLFVRDADKITYAVGDDFVAAYDGDKGIYVVPELLRAWRLAPNGRFLQVSYELADVFVSTANHASVAQVHVVAEVFFTP